MVGEVAVMVRDSGSSDWGRMSMVFGSGETVMIGERKIMAGSTHPHPQFGGKGWLERIG